MEANQPLQSLRILDLSRILAGPWATQFFADLGADVIKVERPDVGDDTRHWGPPWMQGDHGKPTSESAYFLSCNRGKRSLCVDIASTAGQTMIRDLVPHCDVLVENFKVGTMARYGLGFDALSTLHAPLIYCSISGFGQTGPNAHRAGYDAMIQAEAGLMSLTGDACAHPVKTGVAVSDLMTGMYAAASILAAVYARQTTKTGTHIDLALHDVQVSALANQSMNYLLSGNNPQRHGNAHPNIVPYQTFEVADGHLMIAVGNDQQFRALCSALSLPALADDERFATNTARVANRSAVIEILQSAFRQQGITFWRDKLDALGVPCGPVQQLDRVFASEQVSAREQLRQLKHPLSLELPSVAQPARFSGMAPNSTRPPPLLGQHSEEIIAEFALHRDPK